MSERQLPNREVPVRIVYRKKGHGSGHHGGAWKVAFADFMTAMFALFLVLWLVNQSSDVKSAIAGYFQDPLGRANEFGSSIMPGEGAQAATARVLRPADIVDMRRDRLSQFAKQLRERIDALPQLEGLSDHIEIQLVEDGLRIQLLEDSTGMFFETGSSAPSHRGQALLALLGAEMAALPNHLVIEGHTDARPYSGARAYSNWELSTDRANSARRIMSQHGLPDSRVDQVRGFADRDLRVAEDPLSPTNRRVTITLKLDGPASAAEGAPPDSVPGPLAAGMP